MLFGRNPNNSIAEKWTHAFPYSIYQKMNLPEAFVRQMRELLGNESEAFFSSLEETSPVSIRLNRLKPLEDEERIAGLPVIGSVVWCEQGRYLSERPSFTLDPQLHAGAYYVQEASSMFLCQAAGKALEVLGGMENRPLRVLDLCAAPGGKSTLLANLLPDDSLLVTNEPVHNRANILCENLQKWGRVSVAVSQNEPADFAPLRECFDLILTDVPCSGEGMFRKEPAALEAWSLDNVRFCAERQRGILKDIYPCLKPGGFLIYSTCTYNTEENEENVRWLMETYGMEAVEIAAPNAFPEITGPLKYNAPVCRFLPHKTRGEGLFMALLHKPDTGEGSRSEKNPWPVDAPRGGRKKLQESKVSLPDFWGKPLNSWLPSSLRVEQDRKGRWFAFPQLHYDFYQQMSRHLTLLMAGVCLGECKGKDFIPSPAWALSGAAPASPAATLDRVQALAYLHREALTLPESCPKGFLLVKYQQRPLGWVKQLGKRANNLYPAEWRIRIGI